MTTRNESPDRTVTRTLETQVPDSHSDTDTAIDGDSDTGSHTAGDTETRAPLTDSPDSAAAPIPAAPLPDAEVHRRRLRLPTFGLSATQLAATGLAAITATFAASYLGVTGTVIGAALASVVTAAGKEVYSTSLRRTRDAVRVAVPSTRIAPRPATDHAPQPAANRTPLLPAAEPHERGTRLFANPVVRRTAFGAMALFVALLTVVTGVELVAGRPVSDLVRGDSGHGTSFFGNRHVTTRTVTPSVTPPTQTVTVTPKVVVTTPTVTQTASPVTQTNTPSTSTSHSVGSSRSATPNGSAAASQSRNP